eukprot:TRINITY_DN8476_c0_g3_i2.p1 TRINITY_DN8476_c0_g3~~TRINITY_DN8476_c0_g3_i2.p1  ORF type:complete len:750 (-),score=115.92 TRINITY_DN8476_c0_g3_i2:109-2034(-)
MESYILSLSSTMQTREHSKDLENSKKLQFSSGSGNMFATAVIGSSYNPSFEGIPVYTCPMNERNSEVTERVSTAGGLSINEEWKQECLGHQESMPFLTASYSAGEAMGSIASSHKSSGGTIHSSVSSAQFTPRSVSKSSTLQPKFFTSPSLNSSLIVTRQANRSICDRDITVKDDAYGSNRLSLVKDTLPSGINSKINIPSVDQVASAFLSSSDSAWRPRGILVAHLQEHKLAVNDIAVAADNNFFVTASDDGTVKVWDSRRLEKDISFRSKLTYTLDNGRALHAMMCSSGSLVAVGSSTGTIRVFSVNSVRREGGGNERCANLSDVYKKESQEGAILSLQNFGVDGPPMILYSTQLNRIHLWDLRARKESWTLKANPEEGYLSALLLGPCQNWLISGSSSGLLTLWDIRFLIPVNTWRYPLSCPIEKMCILLPISTASSSIRDGPFVYVAAGFNEMALCDVKYGSFHRIFRPICSPEIIDSPFLRSSSQVLSKCEDKTDPKQNAYSKFRLSELNDPAPHIAGIRTLLPLQGGDVLTGGSDMKIRLWDHASPERSYCICGPSAQNMGKESYTVKSVRGVQIVQEAYKNKDNTKPASKSYIAAAATDSAGCHRDCILSLASVQLNQRLLLSSSRDGAVKVWK